MIWALIIIAAFILDRLSKVWVMDSLVSQPITVINNFFYLRHLQNKGAAFSIFRGKTLFLVILTFIIIIALVYFLVKHKVNFLRICLSLIIGGALGNFFDRIFNDSSVIDFIEFHFGTYVFPTFNIADCFVVVGTILLAIYAIFIYKDNSETGEK